MLMTTDELKAEWNIYSCNGWVGVHRETGKKVKCGTLYSLLFILTDFTKYPKYRGF